MFAHFHHFTTSQLVAFLFSYFNRIINTFLGQQKNKKRCVHRVFFSPRVYVNVIKRKENIQELCTNRITLNAYKIGIILHDRNVSRATKGFLMFLLVEIVGLQVSKPATWCQTVKAVKCKNSSEREKERNSLLEARRQSLFSLS